MPSVTEDPQTALRAARHSFVFGFADRCSSFATLIDSVGVTGDPGPTDALIQLVHKTAGLGGMVGLPTVSDRARELEHIVREAKARPLDVPGAQHALTALREAFEIDMAAPAPTWAATQGVATHATRVLLVEDEPLQRMLVLSCLQKAGHQATAVDRGELAVEAVRRHRPDIVLLDIDLPGIDGFDVCRHLKADTQLHGVSVIFMSGRAGLDDRVRGLALGADDYLTKPVDLHELVLRIQLAIRRRRPDTPAEPVALTFDTFSAVATQVIAQGAAALALIRIQREHTDPILATIAQEIRRRDLIGRYDESHALVLFPDCSAADAADRVASIANTLAGLELQIFAGISATTGSRTFEQLLEEADEGLAEARYLRRSVSVGGGGARRQSPVAQSTVLIAEDDPDVMRVIDAQLKAAGYRTITVFDGQQAMDAIRMTAPDLVLLDMMMPRMTGFDVLAEMRRMTARKPKTIVVSARGREADVTRAFELGADDYLTKPFSAEELVARAHRLLR